MTTCTKGKRAYAASAFISRAKKQMGVLAVLCGSFAAMFHVAHAATIDRIIYESTVYFSEEVPERIEAREYEPIAVTIRGEKPIVISFSVTPNVSSLPSSRLDIRLLNRPMSGCGFPICPPPPKFPLVLPGLPPGEYVVNLFLSDEPNPRGESRRLSVAERFTLQPIRAFVHDQSGRMTMRLSHDFVAPLFDGQIPVEEGIYAWRKESDAAPASTLPVHSFVYNATQPPTYYFTLRTSEMELLRRISGWSDQGPVFRAIAPVKGTCPFATRPVYQAFNGVGVATHRYTVHASAYAHMVAGGEWAGEGVAFCVAQ
jgi:hypothetical protein